MTGASFSLQTAIFSALSADAMLQSLIGARLYDAVPQAPTFPYAVIGDDAETNWDTATESGSEHIVTIDAWSQGGGHKESKAIADAVRAVLDGASLAPSGQTLIDIRYQGAAFTRADDGETYRATLKFRAVLEPQ
ncbi:MAG TPA: DUF3168 domain-containing protein [Rhizomicrobium sp.]|jgi:hypothetical protein